MVRTDENKRAAVYIGVSAAIATVLFFILVPLCMSASERRAPTEAEWNRITAKVALSSHYSIAH